MASPAAAASAADSSGSGSSNSVAIRWLLTRVPPKTLRLLSGVVRMVCAKVAPTRHDTLATMLREVLFVRTKMHWQVIVGQKFYYDVSFLRGHAAAVSLDNGAARVLIYQSGFPVCLEAGTIAHDDGIDKLLAPAPAKAAAAGDASAPADEADDEIGNVDAGATISDYDSPVAIVASPDASAPRSLSRVDDMEILKSGFPKRINGFLFEALRVARAESKGDPVELAIALKRFALRHIDVFGASVPLATAQRVTGTLRKQRHTDTFAPAVHVIVGDMRFAIEASAGRAFALMRAGSTKALLFMHSNGTVEQAARGELTPNRGILASCLAHPMRMLKSILFLLLFGYLFTMSVGSSKS